MSANQSWKTPQWLFDSYNKQYNFVLDAAADDENYKCPIYLTEKENGLKTCWVTLAQKGWVWCNPPWNDVESWVEKAIQEWDTFSQPSVLLLPVRTCQQWFHTLLHRVSQPILDSQEKYHTAHIRLEFFKGRIQFDVPLGIKASSNPERNMIVALGATEHGIYSQDIKVIRHLALNPL